MGRSRRDWGINIDSFVLAPRPSLAPPPIVALAVRTRTKIRRLSANKTKKLRLFSTFAALWKQNGWLAISRFMNLVLIVLILLILLGGGGGYYYGGPGIGGGVGGLLLLVLILWLLFGRKR